MEGTETKNTTPTANTEVREYGFTKSEFSVIWQSIHLKVTDEYAVPPEILQVNGSTIGTLGNFSASTGKAKSKKTFNVSAIVAAALSNSEVLRYTAAFPDDKRKVLYVDTEQSKYHCQKVMKRILQLAGLPTDKVCPNLIDLQSLILYYYHYGKENHQRNLQIMERRQTTVCQIINHFSVCADIRKSHPSRFL